MIEFLVFYIAIMILLVVASKKYRTTKVDIKNLIYSIIGVNAFKMITSKEIKYTFFDIAPHCYILWGILQQSLIFGIVCLLQLFIKDVFVIMFIVTFLFALCHYPNIFLIFAVSFLQITYIFMFFFVTINPILFILITGCLHAIGATILFFTYTEKEHHNFQVLNSFK